MSLRLPIRILSSASFRLTMAYATLFVIVTLAIVFAVGSVAMFYFEADLKDEVISEVEELEAVLEKHGLPALLNSIEERAEDTGETGLSYELLSPTNEHIAGNLRFGERQSGWFEFVPPGEEDDEIHMGRAVQLKDGMQLVVGIDLEIVLDAWELMLAGTGWTLGISFPLALLCGGVMSAMVLRRIETLSVTTKQIRDGGLHRRAPLRGTNDEFDRLTAHINAMLDSIEMLTRNIQEVSSGIAHDLRTPLTRVSTRLQALQGQEVSRERLEQETEAALKEIGSLLETFDALLRIGQIEAGTRRAGFQELDVSMLLGEIAETYEVMAAANEKSLRTTIDPGVRMLGDRALIVQMVANVLENAIVHTPAQTEISLSLSKDKDGDRLTVADNGPGVPKEELGKLFRHFFRTDRSRRTNGSGLGMSIVRSIAGIHEIAVTLADNNPGLRVEFHLPGS